MGGVKNIIAANKYIIKMDLFTNDWDKFMYSSLVYFYPLNVKKS